MGEGVILGASKLTIAIDGPAGAGKSTIAKLVAQRLGYRHLDTGAMYRAVTWKAIQEGVCISSEEALGKLSEEIKIEIGNDSRIFIDGEDITEKIRSPEVDRAVSPVSKVAEVREELVAQQRRMALGKAVVMEGRDIGTVVLPQADVKIYLTASLEERARRRVKQLKEKGISVDLETVIAEIKRRDSMDSERALAPLRKADEAVLIDTTSMSIEGVVEAVLEQVERRAESCSTASPK